MQPDCVQSCRCVVMLGPACHAGPEGVAHVQVLAHFGAGPKSALASKLEKLAQMYDVKVVYVGVFVPCVAAWRSYDESCLGGRGANSARI